MPHPRFRYAVQILTRQGTFWPVVGLLGLRQSGKSTVLRDLMGVAHYTTLDDENALEDARLSAKNFLKKIGSPVVIDEAQKAPALFDAIKFEVDKKRVPGKYFLSGSSQFSSRLGIRESLTGRIGLLRLYPFTLGEAHAKEFQGGRANAFHREPLRFGVQAMLQRLSSGGMPVPLFARDPEVRRQYFRNWLETAIYRDTARVYGSNYDPDVAFSLLRQMGAALRNGEYPTLKHFKQNARTVRRYLGALEDIFLLRRIPCHEEGVGQDIWMITDAGLATEVMGEHLGEGVTLSLARISVLNEILATAEYSGKPLHPVYYKSARGGPVDLVWNDSLLKITHLPQSQLAYDERPLAGAMKTLKMRKAILCCSRDEIRIEKQGISYLPWTYWS